MNLPTKALLGALFLCISTVAQAQLALEKTELELNPPPGADSAVATFKYEKQGHHANQYQSRAHLVRLHHGGPGKE